MTSIIRIKPLAMGMFAGVLFFCCALSLQSAEPLILIGTNRVYVHANKFASETKNRPPAIESKAKQGEISDRPGDAEPKSGSDDTKSRPAGENVEPAGVKSQPEETNAPPALSELQRQQEALQQAFEQSRQESEVAARRNAAAINDGLSLIVQSLEAQHKRELDAFQGSSRTTLVIVSLLAGAGLLGVFCLAYFLMRTTDRLTEMVMAGTATGRAFSVIPPSNALTMGEPLNTAPNAAERTSARFLGAVEQLEKRLQELEHATKQPATGQGMNHHDGEQANSTQPQPQHG